MKAAHIVLVALGVALLSGCVVCPQQTAPVRTVSVSGKVETKVAPDEVIWRVNLADTDKVMAEAKRKSDEKIKSVVALQKALRIADGDLETGQLRIWREYERDERGRQGEFKHYVVNRSVTIRQRDLKRFDEFLDALVASAEMEVSFSFESSRMFEVRADLRLKALEAARAKAEAMAAAVGAGLGEAVTINEHAASGNSPILNNMSNGMIFNEAQAAVDAASDRFVPGAITVSSTVYATFALE